MLQLRPRSDFGRLMLCPSPSRWLVLARDELSRDEFFACDNDQGVFEQLHFMNFLLVPASTGLLALLRARCLSLCVECLPWRHRDGGCWSWVVFECPCVSVVSG